MTQQTETCAHPHCNCPAKSDKGYCSDYCAQANATPQEVGSCGCGHPECQKTAARASTPIL